MFERIYLLMLGVFTTVMAVLTWYSWDWLQSIGAPAATVQGYRYYAGISLTFLLISSIVLVIYASFFLARFRRSWMLWATFVYFAVFVIIRYFFLERSAAHYAIDRGLAEPGLTFAPLWGTAVVIGAAAFVFIDQLVIVRLSGRLYPSEKEDPDEEVQIDPDASGDEVVSEISESSNGKL
ncbi:MAG TPA: hypothetical protein PKD26_02305 [Pyrinomonadaceae bacterium]|nr:hypothetical protein [Pyrinomonadaceae bacterium]